jgi:hypothetical protein
VSIALWGVVALALALPGSAASVAPSNEFTAAWTALQISAPKALGARFACIVPLDENGATQGPPTRLRLLITSRRALPSAHVVVRKAKARRVTRILVVSPRYSAATRQQILSQVRSSVPPQDAQGVAVLPRAAGYDPNTCAPLIIAIARPTETAVSWAEAEQQMWGADRIEVQNPPVGPIPVSAPPPS